MLRFYCDYCGHQIHDKPWLVQEPFKPDQHFCNAACATQGLALKRYKPDHTYGLTAREFQTKYGWPKPGDS